MTSPGDRPPSDRLLVARGAASGLLISVPAAFLNVLLGAQDPKPAGLLALTYLVVVAGFVLAGFVVGRETTQSSARLGTLAALAAFAPVEVIAVLGRLDRGDHVSLPGIVILGFLAAAAGHTGASLGARRHHRSHPGRSLS